VDSAGEGLQQYFYASDGVQSLEMDLGTGSSQLGQMPGFAAAIAAFTPPAGFSDTIYGHPLAGTIGSPFDDRIFPTGLAQREGTYTPIAIEQTAGRECLVVDWSFPNGARASRYWVDLQTGVLLRGQEFGKGGGEDLQSEFVMDQVIFDPVFNASLFSLQLKALPGWSDPDGELLEESQPLPATGEQSPSGLFPTAAGWSGGLYFFASDHVYMDETVRLLSLPRACLEGSDPCPEAQEIATPFPLKFSLTALVWSPSGDVAALAYPVSEDGNTSQLFLFNPSDGSWTQLAQYNFIDPPLWSPDGEWLAFRTQDGLGGEEFYAIRRDGSGLTNLISQIGLEENGTYRLHGWTSVGVILTFSSPNGSQRFYTVPVDGSPTLLMPVADPAPDWLVPSPDGNSLLLGRLSDGKRLDLELADSFGVVQRTLASFSGGSPGWVSWSPDGSRFAFVRTIDDLTSADVYVFSMLDGLLSQVYRGQTIGGLAFSPDAGSLVVQDDDPTGRHLFVIDLQTFDWRMVQAPNLALDEWWLAPSWQPLP
jgi:WD40 repeat protein